MLLQKELVACGALRFGNFTLASGRQSSYYVDIKQASSRPDILRHIASEMKAKVGDAEVLAGVELGAVPILVALSLESGLPFAIIRKQAKAHGTGNRIEGVGVEDRRVLLVEDVCTSGKSVLEGVKVLRAAGAVVERVECVVDRGEGATEALAAETVRLGSLVSARDLLQLKEATQ